VGDIFREKPSGPRGEAEDVAHKVGSHTNLPWCCSLALVLEHDVGDDAGGDGYEQELAVIVIAHPVVATRRLTQAARAPVVDDHDTAVIAVAALPIMVGVARPGAMVVVVVVIAIIVMVVVPVTVVIMVVAIIMMRRGRRIPGERGGDATGGHEAESEFAKHLHRSSPG
jgi:hypothetical protein